MANKFTYHHATSEVVQVNEATNPKMGVRHINYESMLARYAARGFAPEDDGKEFEEGVGFEYKREANVNGIWYQVATVYHGMYDFPEQSNERTIAVRIRERGITITSAPAPDKVEAGEVIHELKIWPEYFDDVDSGKKPFEVRKTDRLFGVGDMLHLREWSLNAGYSGRETRKIITYILHGGQWGVQEGNCILGLRQSAPSYPAEFVEWVNGDYELRNGKWYSWDDVDSSTAFPFQIHPKAMSYTTAELYSGPYQTYLQTKK